MARVMLFVSDTNGCSIGVYMDTQIHFNYQHFPVGHISRFDMLYEIQRYLDTYALVQRGDKITEKPTYRIKTDYFKKICNSYYVLNAKYLEIDCIPICLIDDKKDFNRLMVARRLRMCQYEYNYQLAKKGVK